MTSLPLPTAQKVIDAAVGKADEIGPPLNIAVVDDGGHQVALMAACQPGGELYGLEQTSGGLVVFGGGIPLEADGVVIGAVGVSAGSVDQDVAVATAGAAAL